MSYLKQRMESVSKTVSVHLNCLDCDVDMHKMTLSDAKRLEKLEDEDPVKATLMILSNFVYIDGEPIAGEDDLEVVGDMTAEMVSEIAEKFSEINGGNLEDLKKKAAN